MLKTYRIIPLVFILFLFGFTLITVTPVLAEDSPEFVACQQIKPGGDFQTMKNKKDCFRDVARLSQQQSGDSMQLVAPTIGTSLDEVVHLNTRIAEAESQVTTLTTTNAQLQEQITHNAQNLCQKAHEHYNSRLGSGSNFLQTNPGALGWANGFMRIIGEHMQFGTCNKGSYVNGFK